MFQRTNVLYLEIVCCLCRHALCCPLLCDLSYGFDPHDDSDFLTIHDNIVYDNTWHGELATRPTTIR